MLVWGDIGVYGGGEMRGMPTPHIDRLAREGLQFTQFLVEPGCTPSRAALMTGRYSCRSGLGTIIIGGTPNTLQASEVTMAELFKSQGYATGIAGKWHLGSEEQSWPTRQGFDEYHVGVIETTDGTLYRGYMQRAGIPESESGNGDFADVLTQIDAYTGELLDTIQKLGIADNTIFIFTADNGPEMMPGYQGWSGPWRGSYFTAREGSLRVPFIMRWPRKVPAGAVSNEIAHQMDLFPTFAKIVGGKVPTDRITDGVDQSQFFLGNNKKSAREGFVIYVGEQVFGVKWRNWKMLTKEFDNGLGTGKIVSYGVPRFINLYEDPQESYPITYRSPQNMWVRYPMSELLVKHMQSMQEEPPIKPGTPDPFVPAKK